jgi:hypothetical protein
MTVIALHNPFPYGTKVGSRMQPYLTSPWLQRMFRVPVFLSWRTFTLSRTLHPGIWLLRRLRPPCRTLAFSRPGYRPGGCGVPQFRCIRRLEIPVAACCAPVVSGSTERYRRITTPSPHTFWFRCLSHFHLFAFTTLSRRFLFVSIGIRSGQSASLWLKAAELLSLGFLPQRVPLAGAGQVDLTPLIKCNRLNRLSLCPVRGRARLKAGAQRTLLGVGSTAMFK